MRTFDGVLRCACPPQSYLGQVLKVCLSVRLKRLGYSNLHAHKDYRERVPLHASVFGLSGRALVLLSATFGGTRVSCETAKECFLYGCSVQVWSVQSFTFAFLSACLDPGIYAKKP